MENKHIAFICDYRLLHKYIMVGVPGFEPGSPRPKRGTKPTSATLRHKVLNYLFIIILLIQKINRIFIGIPNQI